MDIIKNEIKGTQTQTQEKLSTVNANFLEFVEKNPDTLKRSSFNLLELNDWLFTLQPWPTFINRKTKKVFIDAGIKLFNLIKNIPKRVFNNDPYEIGTYFEVPVNLVKLQLDGLTDDHIDNILARGDFILSSTGLKCLEYNVSANLGGLQVPIWESLYLNTPILSEFFKKYHVKPNNENLLSLLLEQIIHSPLEKLSDEDTVINIAVVMEGFVDIDKEHSLLLYLNKLYKELLLRKSKRKSLKGKVFFCDYQHLKVVDNYVFFKDKKIHALIEMYHGVVPHGILKVFKSGNISIFNGPISNLLSNKLTLAVLSDYEAVDTYTDEEKKIIDTYVPWTRKISPGGTTYGKEKIDDLEDFIFSNREKLVIKPGAGLGGEGVCIGRKSSEEKWEKVLKTAVREKKWLVQELVESSPGLYQCGENGYDLHDTVWGFFIFGSRYSGAWARVMPQKSNKGVINCHQGATVSIIFEVEE